MVGMVMVVPDHVKPWFRVSVCHVMTVPAVVIASVADRVRVSAALGNKGARDRRDGEEKEQDERDTHAGELAPEPATPAA